MTNNDFATIKAQASLKEYAEAKLEHKRGGYICPVCGSGTGPKGTPAFSIAPKGDSWKCFACNESGDVFDLAGHVTNSTDKRAQLEEVAAFFGLPLEAKAPTAQASQPKAVKPKPPAPTYADGQAKHRDYIKRCQAAFKGSEGETYATKRGFTAEECEAMGFGYDAAKKRLVIPFGKGGYYHVDRDVTGAAAIRYLKPKSEEVGPQPVFNSKAVNEPFLFITEGPLDACAIMAAGYPAIALCSTGSRHVVDYLKQVHYDGVCVLALDQDEAGIKAAKDLASELDEIGVSYHVSTYPEAKDPAEYLQTQGKQEFFWWAESEYFEAVYISQDKAEERYREAMASFRAYNPMDVAAQVYGLDGFPEPIPTGFDSVDEALNGGLRPGSLTILGAISSLGKTTLAVQMADSMAQAGYPVLFVTIEQSAREIASKSLSRLMRECGGIPDGVASTTDITSAAERATWHEQKEAYLLQACEAYTAQVAPNLRIMEGQGQPSVSDVQVVAEFMHNHYDKPPVIFIDYLQLLKAQDERDSDKTTTDKNVMSLRQMARNLQTPVFVISSLNRSSYSGSISLDSFKESGAIEYGADVLLGLQPEGIEERLEDVSEQKKKSAAQKEIKRNKTSDKRACELKILKQRAGRIPESGVPLTFYPVSSVFEEPTGKQRATML